MDKTNNLSKAKEFQSWEDEFNWARKELYGLRLSGEIGLEVYNVILTAIHGWLQDKNPVYIERMYLCLCAEEVTLPKIAETYFNQAIQARYLGDESKNTKIIKNDLFNLAYKYVAYFKSVGASTSEACLYAAVAVESLSAKSISIKASTIEKYYPKKYRSNVISYTGESKEDLVANLIDEDEKLRLHWLELLELFRAKYSDGCPPMQLKGNRRD